MNRYEVSLQALQQTHDKSLELVRQQFRQHIKASRASRAAHASALILEHACKNLKRQMSLHAKTKERMVEEQRKQAALRKQDLHKDMGTFRKQLIEELVLFHSILVLPFFGIAHSLLAQSTRTQRAEDQQEQAMKRKQAMLDFWKMLP